MRAARLMAPGRFEMQDIDVPEPGPGDAGVEGAGKNAGQLVDDMLQHMSWAYSGEEEEEDMLPALVFNERLVSVFASS